MPVVSKSLTDALKQILQSFQVPFIFPAAVLVLATFLLFGGEIKLDEATAIVIALAVTTMVSYLLYAFNIPIIRLVEGYTLENSWFFRLSYRLEKKRYDDLQKKIEECDLAISQIELLRDQLALAGLLTEETKHRIESMISGWINRKRPLEEWNELHFAVTSEKPLPTSLGNAIAAFEDYPWSRYCMDAVHLWPRLLPLLEEKKFTPYVQNEKAIFDFLLNTGLVAVGLCFELVLVFGLANPDWRYLPAIALLALFAYILYRAAVVAAVHWGGMVRVAFDLYRDDLRQALRLPRIPDESLSDERFLWRSVSNFIVFGNEQHFKGFVYSTPKAEGKEATCSPNP